MRGITVRFGDTTYDLIGQEAKVEGISPTAFIREATIIRAVVMRARRGEYDDPEYRDLIEAARTFLERGRDG